jgi:hypothetical protein
MRNRRLAALVLLTLYLPACSRWMEQSQPVPQVVAEKRPNEVRLYLADGRVVELRRPHVVGDSVVGQERPGRSAATGDLPYARAAYALEDVQRFEMKEADTGKTWLVAGVIFVVLGVVVLALGSAAEVNLAN